MASRELEVRITGDPSSLSRAFKKVGGDAKTFDGAMGRSAKSIAKWSAVGVAAAGAVAAAFGAVGIREVLEQEKVTARTTQVIKTMGASAWTSKDQIEALSKSLERATGTADDTIQAGANLLLTFGNVRNEVGKGNDIFNQSVAIANDMSAALAKSGQENVTLEKTAMQVGKALNDPIRGMTALRKVGVSFTEDQKEQVKALVESGNQMGAQKLILAELNREFGGAAATEGPLTEGWQKIQRTFEDVAESIMVKVVPAVTWLIDFVQVTGMPILERLATLVSGALTRGFDAIGPSVAKIGEQFKLAFNEIRAIVEEVWPEIQANILEGVRVLGPVIMGLVTDVVQLFRALAPKIRPVLLAFQGLIVDVAKFVRVFWDRWGEDLMRITRQTFEVILRVAKPLLMALRSAVQTLTALIEGDWAGVWKGLKGVAVNLLKAAFAAITGLQGLAMDITKRLAAALLRGFVNGLKALAGVIRSGIVTGLRNLGDLPGALLNKGIELGKAVLKGIVDGIKSSPGAVASAIKSLIPSGGPSLLDLVGGAGGGFTPGPYLGRDDRLVKLAGNEAVLTPRQQSMVPGGVATLAGIFQRTGATLGGTSFARGGALSQAAAIGQAAANSGIYSQGGADRRDPPGSNRTGPKYYDCSGLAGVVAKAAGANVPVGGTTYTYYQMGGKPGNPSKDPVTFGYAHFGSGGPAHMFVTVNGKAYNAHSWDMGIDNNPSPGAKYVIPPGLEGLSGSDFGSGTDAGDGTTGGPAPTNALGRALSKKPVRLSPGIVGGVDAAVEGVSRGSSLREKKVRAAAEAKAAASGITNPEKIAASGDRQVLVAQRADVLKERAIVKTASAKVRRAIAAQRKRRKSLYASLRKLRTNQTAKRQKIIDQLTDSREKELDLLGDLSGLIRQAADIEARAAELAFDVGALTQEIAKMPDAADTGDAASDTAATADPGPTEGDFLDAASAEAALTVGLGDDLAAAKNIEAFWQRELDAARGSGDPRRIAAAAQGLLGARQSRESIEAQIANTDATQANTDAMAALARSFTGSVAFSFRGQQEVLGRTIAGPSSDRFVDAGVGL